ncbi:MAG: DNA primase [Solirubrobacterales bacterium]|nr:DNA primase [Solirubrobacterales bacterium]
MALFTPETIDRVREATDIVEVVSAHTDLRRSGQRFTGLCPFHDERTPSFSVDPAAKVYHCFGCGVGGDVIRFVQEMDGLEFPDAIESLAARFGVEIEREAEDPRAEAARRRRGRLFELLERTGAFYSSFLWESPKAAKAREYLLGRGLKDEVLRAFGVGFAPSAWDQVLTRGQRAGFSVEELKAAGLIQPGRKGGHYDRFRARIVFPIRDQRGRILGFGARAMSADSKPKYLNSPEGELYRKSRTLYGIDRAARAITRATRAILVEGYTDVLALHQAGVEESVAIMGTAVTPEQLKMIGSLTDDVVLALDADQAGADAMIRAQRVAGSGRMAISVAAMPKDKDPADMLADGGPEEFDAALAAAVDLPTFQVRTALDRADLDSVAGRERALGEVAPVLAAMGAALGRDELVRVVADRLDTDSSLVTERIRSVRPGDGEGEGERTEERGPAEPEARALLTPRELRERALLQMCMKDPERGRAYVQRLQPEHLSALGGRVLAWLQDHLDDPMVGLPRDDQELVSLVTRLVMDSEREPALAEAMEINFMLLEQQRLEDRIAAATESQDEGRRAELLQERAELTDRIAGVETLGA